MSRKTSTSRTSAARQPWRVSTRRAALFFAAPRTELPPIGVILGKYSPSSPDAAHPPTHIGAAGPFSLQARFINCDLDEPGAEFRFPAESRQVRKSLQDASCATSSDIRLVVQDGHRGRIDALS